MRKMLLNSVRFRVALNRFRNWQNRKELPLGSRLPHGENLSVTDALGYANQVVQDFVRYGSVQPEGRDILELGPGANQLVGRTFLMQGAASFLSVDRFDCLAAEAIRRDQEAAWEEQLEPEELDRWNKKVSQLAYNPGLVLETMGQSLPAESFDLILSRAVLEYVMDIDALFAAMARVLKPGGRMLHKIDFRDDGLFSNVGLHPLTRFTLSRATYHAMTSHSYRPTPNLWPDFQAVAARHGFDVQGLVTHLCGDRTEIIPHAPLAEVPAALRDAAAGKVAEIRPQLHADFAHLSDEDFMVSGIFMIAEKRGDS